MTETSVRRRRPLRLITQALTLALVVYVVVTALPEIKESASTLRTAKPLFLLGAVVLEIGAVLTLPQMYRAALRVVNRELAYDESLSVSMSAFALGRALPGGGVAGALYAIRRMAQLGIDQVSAVSAVGIQGASQLASLGVVIGVVAGRAALRGDVPGPVLGLVAVVAAVVAVAPPLAFRMLRSDPLRHRIRALIARFRGPERADRQGDRLDQIAAQSLGPRDMLVVNAWGAANWMCEFGALGMVLLALGGDVKAGVLMVGFGVANMLLGLPHIPGGLGFVEAGMAGTLASLGVDPPLAISVVLLYRVVCFWLPVLAGLGVWLTIRWRTRSDPPANPGPLPS